ncbi:hypothetical protein PTKIN_Ptkin03bG0231800 [Pterospermum kingtungense]
MEDLRSKSCSDGRKQQIIENHNGTLSTYGKDIRSMQNLRSYSVSTVRHGQTQMPNNDAKFRKAKSTNGSSSKSWSFNDPDLQRKKRVASYKAYAVEGKVKGSFKKSLRWLKDRFTRVVHGWW